MEKDFKKFEGYEDNLQTSIAILLDSYGVFWHHVANERKTSIQAGAKLKRKGVKPGVADCIILEPRGKWHGLFIELKVKGGTLSINQKEWLKKAEDRNYKTAVAWSIDEVEDLLKEYLKQ